MKKVAVTIVLALLGICAFASENWTTNFNVGLSLPFYKVKADIDDAEADAVIKGNGINFHLSEQIINKNNGFLFQAAIGLGGLSAEDLFEEDDIAHGFDFDGSLGLGYAFKHDKKALLTATAVLGYDFAFFSEKMNFTSYGYTYSVTCSVTGIYFYLGAELAGTIRLSDKAGLFASCLFATPLGGFATVEAEYSNYSYSEKFDLKSSGYFIRPSFGVSFTID